MCIDDGGDVLEQSMVCFKKHLALLFIPYPNFHGKLISMYKSVLMLAPFPIRASEPYLLSNDIRFPSGYWHLHVEPAIPAHFQFSCKTANHIIYLHSLFSIALPLVPIWLKSTTFSSPFLLCTSIFQALFGLVFWHIWSLKRILYLTHYFTSLSYLLSLSLSLHIYNF